MKFPQPAGKPQFTADWFLWFFSQLHLPDGKPASVEGHHILIAREGLAPGLRELLVLIPKGNHKTTLTGAAMDWHLLTVPNANGYIGAADRGQADEMYRFMVHFIESEPDIAARLLVRQSTREVRSRIDQGFAKVLASDDSKQGGKKQGLNPTFFDLDELHAHENDNLYIDGRSGLFKRDGRLWTISTAGWDLDGVLGRLRANFLAIDQQGGTVERGLRVLPDGSVESHADGRLTIARSRDGRSVMLEWANREDDDIDDAAVVKLANPASTVTLDSIEDSRNAPGITPWAFKRYRCNLWTLGYDSWLPHHAWDALGDDRVPVVEHRTWDGASDAELDAYVDSLYPAGTSVVGAVDMARYRDCAALVLLGEIDGLTVPRAVVWRSGGPDNPIPYAPVYRVARRVYERYQARIIGLDQKYLDEMYATLEAEGLPVENFPQSNERMGPAAVNLRQAILTDKAFAHDGDPVLAAHVMAAVAKDIGSDTFKLVKSKGNGPPIDACIALAMAKALYDVPPATWAVIF